MTVEEELKVMLRDIQENERNMIDEYMVNKKLVKVKSAPHAYRWK